MRATPAPMDWTREEEEEQDQHGTAAAAAATASAAEQQQQQQQQQLFNWEDVQDFTNVPPAMLEAQDEPVPSAFQVIQPEELDNLLGSNVPLVLCARGGKAFAVGKLVDNNRFAFTLQPCVRWDGNHGGVRVAATHARFAPNAVVVLVPKDIFQGNLLCYRSPGMCCVMYELV